MSTLVTDAADRPYKIRFEDRPGYLYVMVQVETSNYAIAKKYWIEILTMQRRRGYDRILLDKQVVNSMPIHDAIMLMSELAHSRSRHLTLAIHDRNYDAERCRFEEMAGSSRGLSLKICSRMSEALAWLADKPLPHFLTQREIHAHTE